MIHDKSTEMESTLQRDKDCVGLTNITMQRDLANRTLVINKTINISAVLYLFSKI